MSNTTTFVPRVLIADADPDWCGFLANLIRDVASQRHLLAYDYATVERLLRTHPIAVCILPGDILPGAALDSFAALKRGFATVQFIFFITDVLEKDIGRDAFLSVGATAVLARDEAINLLPQIIRTSLAN